MSKKINMQKRVTLEELRRNIPLVGADITYVIQSEPGCGKTSLLKMLEEDLGDEYEYIYVDCPLKSIEDIGMNVPNHQAKSLEYYVAGLFNLDSPKKKMILLDELLKSPKLLQVIFTRAMLEKYIGDRALPDGSIIFATSNNEADGVGDSMLSHAGNRVTRVELQKPNHVTWLPWASVNGVSALTRAWVALNPRCLASYRDGGQEDNPLIFNPAKRSLSFCSPRSIFKNDVFVRNFDKLGESFAMASIAGTIGEAAAESLSAFIRLRDELVSVNDILADPEGAPVPEKMGAVFMTMFNATDAIQTQDDLSKFVKYVHRVKHDEAQSVFFSILYANKRTTVIAKNNADVMAWYKKNYMLMI